MQVLENMSEITYSSTWSEAQVLLLENAAFKNDVSLLGMDKEDALIGELVNKSKLPFSKQIFLNTITQLYVHP